MITLLRGPVGTLPLVERWISVDDPADGLALVPHESVAGGRRCEVRADSGPAAPGAYLLMVSFAVPPSGLAQFDDWYDTEHAPLLLAAPSWLRVRRLLAHDAPPGERNCFVLHELADLQVLDGPERAAAQRGPKRAEVAALPWYASSRRWTFTPLP